MLKKMYLVTPEQFHSMKTRSGKTDARKRRRKPSTRRDGHKDSKDGSAYNKWLQVKKRKEEERILDKTVVKRIAQFLGKVMPAQVPSQPIPVKHEIPTAVDDIIKREPPVRSALVKKEDVYESTPARAQGDIDEQEALDYTARHFGKTASPYLVRYVYADDDEFLDTQYGIRRVDNNYMIGDTDITIDAASNIYVKDRRFRGTKGLWELLTQKKPDLDAITSDDYEKYKSILLMTSGHLEQYRPDGNVHVSRGPKYRTVISKLFPKTRIGGHRRRETASLQGRKWLEFK
jgi:hypothetical protein